MQDPWASGTSYERYMGRWSRLIGREFLDWLAAGHGCSWLDVGCGTGSLTQLILETQEPAQVTSIDSSSGFIAHAQAFHTDPRVRFRVGLAQALDLAPGSVDVVVSGLLLNFVPQPEQAVREMRRVAGPGARVGAFVWDYAQGMEMLRVFWDAALRLDGAAGELDEGRRFPLCMEGGLERLLRQEGLHDVQARGIEVETVFKDFADYWQPFLGNVGPAPAYVMSLDAQKRKELEEQLKSSLPRREDGSIALKARAWAAKGTLD